MRIALVTDTYMPQVNGVTTVVQRIADGVRAAGHGVAVVAPRYPHGSDGDGGGGEELRVPSLPFPLYPSIRLSFPLYRHVARCLDRFAPDLIHVATEGPLGVMGRRYAMSHDLPLVTSFHTDFPRYARDYGLGFLTPFVWRWLLHFHRPARLIQTPGIAVRDDLVRRGLRNTVVWGRGVDTQQFHPDRRQAGWRRWMAGGDDAVIVLHVGRLAREKNLTVLVDAWRRAQRCLGPRATFVVAGEGPKSQYVATRAPFARQLGFLDRDTLALLYASSDLCVLPSRTETCTRHRDPRPRWPAASRPRCPRATHRGEPRPAARGPGTPSPVLGARPDNARRVPPAYPSVHQPAAPVPGRSVSPMLILLSLVGYVAFGLPFVAWLGHRLAQAHPDHTTIPESPAVGATAPEVAAG